jgi:hypothetical protein
MTTWSSQGTPAPAVAKGGVARTAARSGSANKARTGSANKGAGAKPRGASGKPPAETPSPAAPALADPGDGSQTPAADGGDGSGGGRLTPEFLADPAELAVALGRAPDDPKVLFALRAATRRFRGQVGHPVTQVVDDVVVLDGNGRTSLLLPVWPSPR